MKNSRLKNYLLYLLLLTSFSVLSQKRGSVSIEEQAEKAWPEIVELLKKEADYFNGKNGRLRLLQMSYNDFKIEKFSVEENDFLTTITVKMHLTNRFQPEFESVRTEITTFDFYLLTIKSVTILYDYLYYFDDFPNSVFLVIEQHTEEFNQTLSIKEKNPKTALFEEQPTEETTTDKLIFPIRAKNREKILKAIDAFQSTLLKQQLFDETHH